MDIFEEGEGSLGGVVLGGQNEATRFLISDGCVRLSLLIIPLPPSHNAAREARLLVSIYLTLACIVLLGALSRNGGEGAAG